VQARKDIANTLTWVEKAAALGDDGLASIDLSATARWLGEMLSVPGHLMRDTPQRPQGGRAPAPAAAGPPAKAGARPTTDPNGVGDGHA
jgi:hypothetical protein